MRAFGKLLKRIAPATLVAVTGLIFAWQATDGLGALTAEAARRLKVERNPIQIADVELTDYTGRRVSLSHGKITLVEFIYTRCPTICQSAGDEFLQLHKRLLAGGMADRIQLLSVSFDPVFDDDENLSGYAELHGADGETWTVARPKADAIPDLLKTFGVTVIKDGFGGFQHNIAIHIVDQKGRLVAILDTGDIDGAVDMAESLL